MSWHCPVDRQPLERDDGRLTCSACRRGYPTVDGIPILASDDAESVRLQRPIEPLDKLWALLQESPFDAAVDRFCEQRSFERGPFSADWRFFLAVPSAGHLLELGPGLGDDLLSLAPGMRRITLIVPHLLNGRILSRRLSEHGLSDLSVAVLGTLDQLPLPDRSVDALALEDAAAGSFGLRRDGLARAAREWSRVLRPGGRLFLGLTNSNPWLPGLAMLRAGLRSRERPEPLNRFLKRAAGPEPADRFPLASVVRLLDRHGFDRTALYAPLPDERRTELVLPVEDARVVRYCLANLIRKNSSLLRVASAIASGLAGSNLLRYVVPYHYALFRRREP